MRTWVVRGVLAGALGTWIALAGGCAAGGAGGVTAVELGEWRGPTKRAEVARAPWRYTMANGQVKVGETLTSRSFRLNSTIPDAVIRERLVQVLEAALLEYRRVAPTAPESITPMESWVFEDRAQWADFTRRNLGGEAHIYLQITRGGYTVGDWFVSHFTAEIPTSSTTAHEGFHQFAARHFKGRLPPFLEEGLSTTFEQVKWTGNDKATSLPRFNTRVNPNRVLSLRTAMEKRATFPLEQLIQMHPGLLLSRPGVQIESFYAQSWAFARFVQEFDNGKYRPGFELWMADTVGGTVVDPTGTFTLKQPKYDRRAVKAVIEHYLKTDLQTLQVEFDAWCNHIAYKEYAKQWAAQ